MGTGTASSPRRALLSRPCCIRCLRMWSSASLMVPFIPATDSTVCCTPRRSVHHRRRNQPLLWSGWAGLPRLLARRRPLGADALREWPPPAAPVERDRSPRARPPRRPRVGSAAGRAPRAHRPTCTRALCSPSCRRCRRHRYHPEEGAMIRLLADLAWRCARPPEADGPGLPPRHSRTDMAPVVARAATCDDRAPPDRLGGPAPEQADGPAPLAEALLALLTDLAWRRARVIVRKEADDASRADPAHAPGAPGVCVCATIDPAAGAAPPGEHRAAVPPAGAGARAGLAADGGRGDRRRPGALGERGGPSPRLPAPRRRGRAGPGRGGPDAGGLAPGAQQRRLASPGRALRAEPHPPRRRDGRLRPARPERPPPPRREGDPLGGGAVHPAHPPL